MMRLFALLFASVSVAYAQPTECFDPALINPDAICLTVVDPVCGCDGITYNNACEAQNYGGVAWWQEGPCVDAPPSCTVQLVTTTEDGMWFTFTAVQAPSNVTLMWYIDDTLMQEGGTVFQAGFDFNPFWTVCVRYESPECSALVEDCYDNMNGGVSPCTDVGNVDFGLCDLALGVALVNGSCQFVSGCGTFVGGVNYAGAMFESMEACEGACTLGDSFGCTYPSACNFDPLASVDDGGCLFPPEHCALSNGGCLYEEALNFNPDASFDDGSCLFAQCASCFGDLTGDASVTVADVLALLGAFGLVCD